MEGGLSDSLLKVVYGSIRRIHLCRDIPIPTGLDIYANYARKVDLAVCLLDRSRRYAEFDYSVFPGADHLKARLCRGLEEHEKNGTGICSLMHGKYLP